VLFSLSAVRPGGSSTPPPPTGMEASGLIDIRQLSAQIAVEERKPNRVDDIMNLTGGGFAPTLTAPAALPPPSLEIETPSLASVGASGPAPASGKKGLILLALGAGACVIAAAVGGAVMMMNSKPPGDTPKAETSANPASSESPTVAPSASASAAPAPSTSESAAASASAAPGSAPAAKAPAAEHAAEGKTAAGTPAPKAAAPKEAANPFAPTPAPAPAPSPAAAAPAAEATGPFNMGEAKARLGAAADSAASCKKPNGPTGSGRVVVVFAPSGAAQSVSVSGPPFEGTPTGACVAARFRAVRVPPFGGSPFSVSKSFTIF
jgi:hypothetical protein